MLAERHITALMHSARIRTKEGNWIASLNIYKRIISENPEFMPAYCELARLYLDRDDMAGARELLRKILDSQPENTEASFLLGVIEYIEGNFDAALRAYRVVERVDGLDCNLAMNIALVCEALGLHKDAIKHLEYALSRGEANVKVYEVLADLYRMTGDFNQEIRVLESAIIKFPGEASLHMNLGLALSQVGEYNRAETSFETASRMYPEDIGPLEELVKIYARFNRIREAVSVLKKLTRLDPDNSQNWLKLARAYYRLGDLKDSKNILEKAKQMFPDNTSIDKELGYLKSKNEPEKGAKEEPGGEKPQKQS